MGASNAAEVLRNWTSLTYRARTVLVAMALTSLDAPRLGQPARRYYGGPDYLAEILAGTVTPSSMRQAEKVLTELVRAGAVERVTRGGNGRGAEYRVILSPTKTVGGSPTRTVELPDQNGRCSPTRTVGPRSTRRDEENREEQHTDPLSSHPREGPPVDNPESEHVTASGRRWADVPLFDVETAAEVVRSTLGIEQAAERIGALTRDGTDYGAAYMTLARELTAAGAGASAGARDHVPLPSAEESRAE